MILSCPSCSRRLPVPDAALRMGNPQIICTACQAKFRAKPGPAAPRPTIPVNRPAAAQYGSTAPGWLVVHDEKTRSQTFTLKPGRQLAGRKSASMPCDIMIETGDVHMSRRNFIIEVSEKPAGIYQYRLSLPDVPPLNPVYINLKKLGETDVYFLKDGDTIQAGETKIVFQSSSAAQNALDAAGKVKATGYTQTIFVKRQTN